MRTFRIIGLILIATIIFGSGIDTQIEAQSTSQQEEIYLSFTTLFEIAEDLCPPHDHCERIWRLASDGNRLFVYLTSSYQLYAIDPDGQISQYNLSTFSWIYSPFFDFVPYSENSILIYDSDNHALLTYDLITHSTTPYLEEHLFVNCNADSIQPVRNLVRPYLSNWMVVCGLGSSSHANRNISVVDLTTDTIYEIATMNETRRHSRLQPWSRVYIGYDGTVYALRNIQDYVDTIPNEDYPTLLQNMEVISRQAPSDSEWSYVPIRRQQLRELGAERDLGALAGVDEFGNMYFIAYTGRNSDLPPQITKVNSQGTVLWFLSFDEIGENPYLIDVTPNGWLIVVDTPNNTTIGVIKLLEVTVQKP